MMNLQKSIIAVALLGLTATAHAAWTASIPEPTTVTLVFIALAALGTAIGHKRPGVDPIDAEVGPT